MVVLKFSLALLCVFTISLNSCNAIFHTTLTDWEKFMDDFNKDYTNAEMTEPRARHNFDYNTGLINNHNLYYERNQRTHKLRINQFSDLRLAAFNRLFPLTQQPATNNASALPPLNNAPNSFDLLTTFGINIVPEDQGVNCNSGWAYAAAKSIEILNAFQTGNVNPNSLSAQNLIDCASRGTGCTNQVPQTAFDFLTLFEQALHTEADYPNNINISETGMCIIPPMAMDTVKLSTYTIVSPVDDTTLRNIVFGGYPIVVEFNPTSFDFMHYGGGVFQSSRANTRTGSHFMVLVGYGTDTESQLDYWLCLNSFGTNWGEGGYIKIARDPRRTIFRSAILPLELQFN